MGNEWKATVSAGATAPPMPSAETCLECGALIELWARQVHRQWHETLQAITIAQERLNRATRSYVRLG